MPDRELEAIRRAIDAAKEDTAHALEVDTSAPDNGGDSGGADGVS